MHKKPLFTALAYLVVLSTGWTTTVGGTITVSVDLSKHPQGEELRLWLPYPVSDAAQSITDITVSGDYSSSAVYTDKIFQTPMLFAKWNRSTTNRNLTLSFQAVRNEISRPAFPQTEAAWNRTDHALYLRPTQRAPLNTDLQQLARKITKDHASVLEKARAIYDWTVENTYRNPATRGCGSGDVCALLKDPGGKCADISSIFIALCRASGVPAREVLGIRMGKNPVQDITTGQHCWAEFFLPGTGWISVDPADVRKKMLVDNLQIDDPATAACREYFFGGIDAYRIKLSHGRDLLPNPEPAGGAINYLMYPFAQAGDQTLDWLDPENFTYAITFTTAPIAEQQFSKK